MKIKREALASEYITEALLLLIRKKEFKNISVTEICQKAGVTRMSFYRSFESKEDILEKWITSVTDRFLSDSEISYKEDSTKEYFIKLFTHMDHYKDICQILNKAGMMHIVKNQFDRVFLELHADEYDYYKSCFLSGGIYNIFLAWLNHDCMESPEEMAERMENMMQK